MREAVFTCALSRARGAHASRPNASRASCRSRGERGRRGPHYTDRLDPNDRRVAAMLRGTEDFVRETEGEEAAARGGWREDALRTVRGGGQRAADAGVGAGGPGPETRREEMGPRTRARTQLDDDEAEGEAVEEAGDEAGPVGVAAGSGGSGGEGPSGSGRSDSAQDTDTSGSESDPERAPLRGAARGLTAVLAQSEDSERELAPPSEHAYLNLDGTAADAGGDNLFSWERSDNLGHQLPCGEGVTLPLLVLPQGAGCLFPGGTLPVNSAVARAAVANACKAEGGREALRGLVAVFAVDDEQSVGMIDDCGCMAMVKAAAGPYRANIHAAMLEGVRRCRQDHGGANITILPGNVWHVKVLPLDDSPAPRPPPRGCGHLSAREYAAVDERAWARRAAAAAAAAGYGSPSLSNPQELSFWLASQLPLSASSRARLLCLGSAARRLRACVGVLRDLCGLSCRRCGTRVAWAADVFAMAGSSGAQAAYVNRHGALHDLLTVRKAERILLVSEPSSEDSWFPGYLWSIMICRCGAHLGWHFSTPRRDLAPREFFGLSRAQITALSAQATAGGEAGGEGVGVGGDGSGEESESGNATPLSMLGLGVFDGLSGVDLLLDLRENHPAP